jgi:predicted transcriptional regulator
MTTTDERRSHGRPRPEETIQRDRAILDRLQQEGPQTTGQLAGALGIRESLVEVALGRLHDAREAHRRREIHEGAFQTFWHAGWDQDAQPRKRPRPQKVGRDRTVLDFLQLHGPRTADRLAAELSMEKSLVDLSLKRLRAAGQAHWVLDDRDRFVWAAGKEVKPRGRPRSPETIRRDRDVLGQLVRGGPQTRNQIAEALRTKQSLVYLSLGRLRGDGAIRKCAGEGAFTIWSADGKCDG